MNFLFWKRNIKVIRERKINLIKYILIYVFAGTKSYRNETWRCKCCIILLMKIWIPPKSDILELFWGLTYNCQFGEYNKILILETRAEKILPTNVEWPRIVSIKPRNKTVLLRGHWMIWCSIMPNMMSSE